MLLTTYTVLAALALGSPSADEKFAETLRAMRLYRLAEVHCEQSLQRANLPADRQATLLVEWSRTLAAAAREASATDAEPLWQRASSVIADFCQRNPQHPRLALLVAQGALLKLDRALWLADDVELLARTDERLSIARTELAAAARRLAEVQDAVERAGRKASPSALRDPAPLAAPELQNLAKRLQFERARGYLRLAEVSAEESPDRVDAFSQARQLLVPLAGLPVEHPLAWPARVAQVSCLRATGDRAGALKRLAALEKADPPPQVARQLGGERARLLALEGHFDEALAMLKPPAGHATTDDPAADELRLELSLAAWRRAHERHDEAQTLAWQDRIKSLANAIEQAHGPHWSRRADRLLAEQNMAVGNAPPPDAELLARTAATHWRDGQADEALAAYDRAAAAAIASNSPERAFDLAFLAAAIEHSRQNWDAAATRYQTLADRWPGHARAAEAHLLSAHDRLQAIQAAAMDDASALDPYIELLLTHLQRWPDSASAAEARWRLGRAYESQSKFREAVDQFRAVPLSSPRSTEAIEAASRGYRQLVAEQQAVAAAQRIAREAGEFFDSLLESLRDKPLANAQRQEEIVRNVRMASARAWLACPPEGYRRAGQVLEPLVSDRSAAGATWQSSAHALFVTALVGDGRIEQARQLLGEFPGLTPSVAQTLLHALAELSDPAAANADRRRELAEFKLLIFEKLGSPIAGVTPVECRALELIEARTLAEAGRADEAASRFAALRSTYPNDVQVLQAQAESLSSLLENDSAAAALAAWRDVERLAKPGSPLWLRSKLELSRLHLRAGDREQAAKIIDLTELLHPELGGAELKGQFAALRREIAAVPAASSR